MNDDHKVNAFSGSAALEEGKGCTELPFQAIALDGSFNTFSSPNPDPQLLLPVWQCSDG